MSVSHPQGPPPSLLRIYYFQKAHRCTSKLVCVLLRAPKIVQIYQILGFAGVCGFCGRSYVRLTHALVLEIWEWLGLPLGCSQECKHAQSYYHIQNSNFGDRKKNRAN